MYDNFIPIVMKYMEPYRDTAQLVRLMSPKEDGGEKANHLATQPNSPCQKQPGYCT